MDTGILPGIYLGQERWQELPVNSIQNTISKFKTVHISDVLSVRYLSIL